MPSANIDLVVVDFESTGSVEGYPNEPWQIGMVHFHDGHINADILFESLLRVAADRPFNPYSPGRHAALRPQLAAARTLHEMWPRLRPWLHGRVLAAHHAATEQKLLEEAFPLHTFGPWVDTLELARIAYPRASSHRLQDLLDALGLHERVVGVCPDRAPHDALFDALGCAALLEHLLDLPHWQGVTLDELTAAKARRTRGSTG